MSTSTGSETARSAARFCGWCGTEMPAQQRGRPRQFCSRSCRQRAYEQRSEPEQPRQPENQEAQGELADEVFQLRCAAEDVIAALDDGAGPEELRPLALEVVELSHLLQRRV